jgi:hypothetical protein
LQTRCEITIRLFVAAPDEAKARVVAQFVAERIADFANILRLDGVKPYWKIPAWYDVFLLVQPLISTQAVSAFNGIISSLGHGWHRGGDEEYPWAVWDERQAGSTSFSQAMRWMNVELYPRPIVIKFKPNEIVRVLAKPSAIKEELANREGIISDGIGVNEVHEAVYGVLFKDYPFLLTIPEHLLESTGCFGNPGDYETRDPRIARLKHEGKIRYRD